MSGAPHEDPPRLTFEWRGEALELPLTGVLPVGEIERLEGVARQLVTTVIGLGHAQRAAARGSERGQWEFTFFSNKLERLVAEIRAISALRISSAA